MSAVKAPPLDRAGFEAACGRRFVGRREYAEEIGEALVGGHGFAAGKLGGSEQAWLTYPVVREREDGMRLRAYETALAHRSLKHSGVWPVDPPSLRSFCERFEGDAAALDAIGLFSDAYEAELAIVERLQPVGMLMPFEAQEPPRDAGTTPEECWLEHLRDRNVLIVCPFASFLRERAVPELYEAVWATARKAWFEPASIEALEFPYGFETGTQRRYAGVLELGEEIAGAMDARDYDVALIAAGGLGIPLAVHAKRAGRVGLSLGGHLQVIFGVHGARWRGRREWEGLFNDAWSPLPERYRPEPGSTGENYW